MAAKTAVNKDFAGERDAHRNPIAFIEVKKVSIEEIPVIGDNDEAKSMGQMVDETIGKAIEKGETILSLTLHIEQETWDKWASEYKA